MVLALYQRGHKCWDECEKFWQICFGGMLACHKCWEGCEKCWQIFCWQMLACHKCSEDWGFFHLKQDVFLFLFLYLFFHLKEDVKSCVCHAGTHCYVKNSGVGETWRFYKVYWIRTILAHEQNLQINTSPLIKNIRKLLKLPVMVSKSKNLKSKPA